MIRRADDPAGPDDVPKCDSRALAEGLFFFDRSRERQPEDGGKDCPEAISRMAVVEAEFARFRRRERPEDQARRFPPFNTFIF